MRECADRGDDREDAIDQHVGTEHDFERAQRREGGKQGGEAEQDRDDAADLQRPPVARQSPGHRVDARQARAPVAGGRADGIADAAHGGPSNSVIELIPIAEHIDTSTPPPPPPTRGGGVGADPLPLWEGVGGGVSRRREHHPPPAILSRLWRQVELQRQFLQPRGRHRRGRAHHQILALLVQREQRSPRGCSARRPAA